MGPSPGSPSPRERRRSILITLLRTTTTASILVLIYFVVPLDRVEGISAALTLAAGLVAVLIIGAWQVHRILTAEHPGLQAVEALTTVVTIYLLVFAAVYFRMSVVSPAGFDEPLSTVDAFYFCLSVFSTVGFGDITAVSEATRAVVSVQMVGNLVFLALGIRLLTAAVQWRRRHPDEGAA